MKYHHRYLKKIPTTLTSDINRIDELFDRMASKWAIRAEKNMRKYRRNNLQQVSLLGRR